MLAIVVVAALLVLTPLLAAAQAIESTANTSTSSSATASNWKAPRTVYIPQTGQTIDGVFLDYWRRTVDR